MFGRIRIDRSRYALAVAALFANGNVVAAEGARIGIEFELEEERQSKIANHAVTLQPGWQFREGSIIDRVELLIEHNQDKEVSEAGRARETKLFLRIRHRGKIRESLAWYVRGGVGRSLNERGNFNYGYVEPGLKYELDDRWEWSLGWREGNSIGHGDGKRVRKLITGPSFSFDKQNEIELRYIRGTGDEHVQGWSVSYVRKF